MKQTIDTTWTPQRIKAIRKAYGETQRDFAARLRVGVGTLRCWEQAQIRVSGPATVILEQLEDHAREMVDT